MPATSLLSIQATLPIPMEGGHVAQLRPFPCLSGPAMETAWHDLERRSLLRNPFLSPSFLLPQAHLEHSSANAQLWTIIDQQGRWLLAGLFERVNGSRHLPLPHLRAVRMEHAFKTGLLVDATECEAVIETLWNFIRRQRLHGISFPFFPTHSSLSLLLSERCERENLTMSFHDVRERATLTPYDGSAMSSRRAKSLRRGRRYLERLGRVSVKFTECTPKDLSPVERFLFLESLGWKGETQSALACRLSEVQAMHEMASSFGRQNRVRFAELSIDERVIASMCLLRSESDYYAFKIGWDPQFERGCPGFLLAAEIQDHIAELPNCERIDSCAHPGSFLDHVWPGRKAIGEALFTTTRWGSLAAHAAHSARSLYHSWKDWNTAPTNSPATPEREFAELEEERS